ncbi:MAG: OmpA family protein [Rikenellaceae bacterium]|nr:OmpA family protein [Rikenellaceae bacterium]
MKRILFTIALVIAALSAFAQQQEVEPKPSHANFVTNKFWDNWEIGAGVGVQTWFFGDNQDEGKFGKRLSYEVDVQATKWITPVFGARLQAQGLQMKSTALYLNDAGESNLTWDDGSIYPQGDWSYYFIHADALINVRNWIGGYKEMRVWQPIVFGGFGYARSHISGDNKYANGNQEWAFSYGLLNKFRISKAVDLTLEAKNMLVRESFGLRGGDEQAAMDNFQKYGNLFSLTAGITYRFNRRGFARPEVCPEPDYSAYNKRIENLENELANAQASADELAKKLAEAEAPVIYQGKEIPIEMIIFFEWDKHKITQRAGIQLDYLAKMMKESEGEFNLVGFASEEGVKQHNFNLSERRVNAIKDALVQRGVPAEKLHVDWKGESVQFPNLPPNRAVIITQK